MLRKGRRIRYQDRNLILRLFLVPFAFCSCLFFFLLNYSKFQQLSEIGLWRIGELFSFDYSLFFSVLFPVILAGVPTLILYALFTGKIPSRFSSLLIKKRHIQNLARLIVSNNWLEMGTSEGNKNRVVYFPKVWYKLSKGRITITTEIPMCSFQEQFMHMEKLIEVSLYCELEDKVLKEGEVVYTFLYDMLGFRISIDEVKAENGRLRLMYDTYWEYDTLPHMLIAGGTGGGKSYFILALIESLLRIDSELVICDPKNSDLADLGSILPSVFYEKDEIVYSVKNFYEEMLSCNQKIKNLEGYETGRNYAYFGLKPHFLIFDEYVAFIDMLSAREREDVLRYIKGILMLGRQMGYFLILACQRPDSRYLAEGARDQFGFRVGLGKMSEMGYSMLFGDVDKNFFFKPIKGRGYVDNGRGLISEFYAPFVPESHDFLAEIRYLEIGRAHV